MGQTANIEKLLYLLKIHGPQTAKQLAEELDMTSMGARQHLQALQGRGLIATYDQIHQRGRPKRFWQLTKLGHQHFPDNHGELAVNLIDSIGKLFGEEGLDKLVSDRQQQILNHYQQALIHADSLEDKIKILTTLRCDEGYMAHYEKQNNHYLLIESHCPIGTVAKSCQAFCQSELQLFQLLLHKEANVERKEHIYQGDYCCSYIILPK